MIVDFDAHHGDGTQSIFEQDSSVLYFSTHQYPTYPGSGDSSEIGRGSGEGYTLNEPLPPGSGDDAFSEVYRNTLPQCMARFKPNLVIVSAGYDVHGDDPLTELTLTDGGVRQIVRSILRASREVGCTTLFTLEGGYDIPALARCTVLTLEEMLFSASGESLSSS